MWHDPGPLLRPFGERGRRLGERFPILFCRKRHVLLKLVYANLNLAWLSAHFPHAQQLYVLRHPCGQFESWRRLGWEPMPERMLLRNERLMADHLHRFEDVLRRAAGYWERAGALWAATTYVVHRQTEAGGGPLVVAYEWLCADPMTRFQELYAQLGLAWNHHVERFLKSSDRSGDTQPYSLNRPSEMQIDKWKQRLTRGEIDACRQFVEPFELPYYPGFEPRTVLDLGGNIGCSAVYFANRWPGAKIVVVEPVAPSFAILKHNTSFYPNVIPVHAAAHPWRETGRLVVRRKG